MKIEQKLVQTIINNSLVEHFSIRSLYHPQINYAKQPRQKCAVLVNRPYLMIYQSNGAEIFRVASRLIEEQVLFFEFCPEMLTRSSKIRCKNMNENWKL